MAADYGTIQSINQGEPGQSVELQTGRSKAIFTTIEPPTRHLYAVNTDIHMASTSYSQHGALFAVCQLFLMYMLYKLIPYESVHIFQHEFAKWEERLFCILEANHK